MTVSSETRLSGPYTCNSVLLTFPFDFKVFSASDLKVVLRNPSKVESVLTHGVDYSVSLNSDQDLNPGGSITTTQAYSTGHLITITSDVPLTQNIKLTNVGGFYPEVINDGFDRLTILCQQLAEQLGRAVKISISSPGAVDVDTVLNTIEVQADAVSENHDSFFGTYYGPLASAPSVNPLGDPVGVGDLYFDTTAQALKIRTSAGWEDTAQASPVSYSSQLFSGNGSTTDFVLSSAPATLIATEVFIAGVRQRPTLDYTLVDNELSFTSAPASGTNNILVRWTYAIAVGVPNDGSVTTPKLQDKAVTFGKMQDISATQRVLGRQSAGAGSVEELTLSQLLDWIGSAAQGDILYRGATSWQRLAAGTAGQKLQTNGVGNNPSWVSSGLTMATVVEITAITPRTTVDFAVPDDVKRVVISFAFLKSNGVNPLRIQLGAGGQLVPSGYFGTRVRFSASANATVGFSNASGFDFNFTATTDAANAERSGVIELMLIDPATNVWAVRGEISANNGNVACSVTGYINTMLMSSGLDMVRVTTALSIDSFNSGRVNIAYE